MTHIIMVDCIISHFIISVMSKLPICLQPGKSPISGSYPDAPVSVFRNRINSPHINMTGDMSSLIDTVNTLGRSTHHHGLILTNH